MFLKNSEFFFAVILTEFSLYLHEQNAHVSILDYKSTVETLSWINSQSCSLKKQWLFFKLHFVSSQGADQKKIQKKRQFEQYLFCKQ